MGNAAAKQEKEQEEKLENLKARQAAALSDPVRLDHLREDARTVVQAFISSPNGEKDRVLRLQRHGLSGWPEIEEDQGHEKEGDEEGEGGDLSLELAYNRLQAFGCGEILQQGRRKGNGSPLPLSISAATIFMVPIRLVTFPPATRISFAA
jgi:hypothetical protein